MNVGPERNTVDMSPELTDTARGAIAWVLYHHHGGNSAVGQPLRYALGLGAHEPIPEYLVAEAKRYASAFGRASQDFTPPAAAVPEGFGPLESEEAIIAAFSQGRRVFQDTEGVRAIEILFPPIATYGFREGKKYVATISAAPQPQAEATQQPVSADPAIPDSFTPWSGGECPEEARGRKTRVIFRGVDSFPPINGEKYVWRHHGVSTDIIGYRVESEQAQPSQQGEAKAGADEAVFYGGPGAFKENGHWCAYVWQRGLGHPLKMVQGDTPLEAVSLASNLAHRLNSSGAQDSLTTCPEGCAPGMICAACDKDRGGAQFADIDAEALRVARLFSSNGDPQGRARMQCRIIAAINGDFGSLVDLTSCDEPDHGAASVLLAECLGLELPCTLAEMVGEIRRLQGHSPKPAEGGAVADRVAIKMLVAAGFVTEAKANEALRIAHGFERGELAPAGSGEAVPDGAEALADKVVAAVAYISAGILPHEWPDAMHVSKDSLRRIILSRIASRTRAQPVPVESLGRDAEGVEALAEEGLQYFEKAGDAGDRKYVQAIREVMARRLTASDARPVIDEAIGCCNCARLGPAADPADAAQDV